MLSKTQDLPRNEDVTRHKEGDIVQSKYANATIHVLIPVCTYNIPCIHTYISERHTVNRSCGYRASPRAKKKLAHQRCLSVSLGLLSPTLGWTADLGLSGDTWIRREIGQNGV